MENKNYDCNFFSHVIIRCNIIITTAFVMDNLYSFERRQIPISDIDEKKELQNENEAQFKSNFDAIGILLSNISNSVGHLEQNNEILGSAIQRFAYDLADSISGLRTQMRNLDEEEQTSLARAFIEDAKLALELQEGYDNNLECDTTSGSESSLVQHDVVMQEKNDNENNDIVDAAAESISKLSENDLVQAFSTVETILSDVETALRSIGRDEAQELADAGLVVARIFLFNLQSFYQNLEYQLLPTESIQSNVTIEVINDTENNDEQFDTNFNKNQSPETQPCPPIGRRVRALWPPIGPAVAKAANWSTDAAKQQPLLAIALGMVLWPTAIISAFIGLPVLIADHAIQSAYNFFADQDAPFVTKLEQGMANVVQVGYLYFLCTKLILKQGAFIGQRQLERRGGIKQVAHDIGGALLERTKHPVETVGMAVNTFKSSIGVMINAGSFVKDVALGKNQVLVQSSA